VTTQESRRPPSARHAAILQLNRVETEGAYVGLVRGDELDLDLDARDERQAREYIAGVTRWQRWLDFLLANVYKGDFEGMEPMLKQVLRVGLYDLLFLRTPAHAALNEAVDNAKNLVRQGAGGLVNGMLRNILRQVDHLPQPDTGDEADDLAIRHSHPTWMVRRWIERLGVEETTALLAWNNARPAYGLRFNTLSIEEGSAALDEKGVTREPSPYLDDFFRVTGLQPVVRAGWLADGTCAVQDESAGLVVRLLDPQPGETIVDACAAPGGKAIYTASRMQGRGRVLAFDLNPARLRMVADMARKQGLAIVETEAGDLRDLAQRTTRPLAHRVLLDAPCSGLGVLSKRADLRWHRREADLDQLTTLQDELLDAAAKLLAPGGVLVYSTCTIEPEENYERVTAFLKRQPSFQLESVKGLVPEGMLTPEGCFATTPQRDGIDGAFGCRLRRAG